MLGPSAGLLRRAACSASGSIARPALRQRVNEVSIAATPVSQQRRGAKKYFVQTKNQDLPPNPNRFPSKWRDDDFASLPGLLLLDLEKMTKDATPLSQAQVDNLLPKLDPGWQMAPFAGSGTLDVLQRRYEFKGYKHAKMFFHYVASLAMQQKHHPECLVGWGHCTVAFWTHSMKGVHINDFICAARVDKLSRSPKYAEGRINQEFHEKEGVFDKDDQDKELFMNL